MNTRSLGAAIAVVGATLFYNWGSAQAGVIYPDPADGWGYIFTGDPAAAGGGESGGLDGGWGYINGSSEWDGQGLGAGVGAPGGIQSTGGALTIMDASTETSGTGNNRKLYVTRDVLGTASGGTPVPNLPDTFLDTGVTLSFRVRLTPGQLENGVSSPNGGVISDDGKGMLGLRQATGDSIISFALHNDVEDNSPTATVDFGAGGRGLTMNNANGDAPTNNVDSTEAGTRNNLPLAGDLTEFQEFWVTIQADGDPGNLATHTVRVFANGSVTPLVFPVTAGNGNDENYSYIGMGSSGSGRVQSIDYDFVAIRAGVIDPIPEPATAGLLGLGLAGLSLRRRRALVQSAAHLTR